MKSPFSVVSSSLKALTVSALFVSTSVYANGVEDSAIVEKSDVILFSAEWCGYCQQAKAFLTENQVDFIELDLDKSDANIDLFESKGGEGIPYLVAGETKVSGFDNQDYKKALKLL